MNNPPLKDFESNLLIEALMALPVSENAKKVGLYIVDHCGFNYAIMKFQLINALGLESDQIDTALDELIHHNFIRDQSRDAKNPDIQARSTYVLVENFLGPNRLMPISSMRYKHYKGGEYEVVCEATLESNPNVTMIIYKSADGRKWARPSTNFFEKVERDGKQVPRFEKVE